MIDALDELPKESLKPVLQLLTDVFRKLERVLATVRIKPIEKQKEGEDVHDVVGGSPESPAISEPASTLLSLDKL